MSYTDNGRLMLDDEASLKALTEFVATVNAHSSLATLRRAAVLSMIPPPETWGDAVVHMVNGINDPQHRQALMQTLGFLPVWSLSGARAYELQHSMAALLAATRAPSLDWSHMPDDVFVLKVPAQFTGIETPSPNDEVYALVFTEFRAIGACTSASALMQTSWSSFSDGEASEDAIDDLAAQHDESDRRFWRTMVRIVSNAVSFITTHRECVASPTRSRHGIAIPTLTVSPPREVVVERAFRDQVARMVSGSRSSARSALMHVVRGHWKRQASGASGSERKLIWVRPYWRGDESVGRVVSKLERLAHR